MANGSSALSLKECFLMYRFELSVQLDFLGADEIDAEDLIEAYFRLRGRKHVKALNFILDREDHYQIILSVVNRVSNGAISRNLEERKSALLRWSEIKEAVDARKEVQSLELRTLMHFVDSQVENHEKHNNDASK